MEVNVKDIAVYIVIPTYNCVEIIERTLNSIYAQNYDQSMFRIVCVDYNSDDGTYEKLLENSKEKFGVYQIKDYIKKEYRMTEAIKILSNLRPGEVCYYLGLYPGDYIYPDFISSCMGLLDNYKDKDIKSVICEALIWNGNEIIQQKPLFNERFVLSPKNKFQYLKRGFSHRVFMFKKERYVSDFEYIDRLKNDLHNWNLKYLSNFFENVIYTPKILGVVFEEKNESELDTLVTNYAAMLSCIRTNGFSDKNALSIEEQNIAMENLAYNALWRSGGEIFKENFKSAENCFMFSKVIYPSIVVTAAYKYLEKYFNGVFEYNNEEFQRLLPEEDIYDVPDN